MNGAFEIPSFTPAIPEIWLLATACALLMLDLFLPAGRRAITFWGTLAILLVGILLLCMGFPESRVYTFSGMFVHDSMGSVLKIAILSITALVACYSRSYLADRGLLTGEYLVLMLFAVLGMMVMVSGASLLTLYLGLELLSLSLYALVALDRDSPVASEVAMKYFVLGAIASGILLYGMSILYGVTGTLEVAGIAQAIATGEIARAPLMLALGFIIVGLSFKLGAVPFHMWIPDVYQGAPTAVTLFIGSAPKIAAFALLMRLLADGLQELHVDWQSLLAILAVLSMALGNLVAIAQTNIKRMLAYSTISHMGFLLLGVMAGTASGYAAAMFYALVYALMSAGAFGMVILLSRAGHEAERLDDFRGLADRSPWFAGIMLILMASMSGLPPMLGFYAKFSVLQAAVGAGWTWLAVAAVVFAIVGAFYYLRVIRLMYFEEDAEGPIPAQGHGFRALLSLNGLAVLGLGFFPGAFLGLCLQVMTTGTP